MKKSLIFLVVLIFFITGCSSKSNNEMNNNEQVDYELRTSDEIIELVSEKNVNDIITKEYSNKELKIIESTDLNIEELDKLYRIECIRIDTSEVGSYYKVVYRSKNKYLFIYFDENGDKLYSFIYRMSKEKNKFDKVEVGKTKKINIFFIDGKNGYWPPRHWPVNLSSHFTKDGFIITYEYNGKNIVQDVKVETI